MTGRKKIKITLLPPKNKMAKEVTAAAATAVVAVVCNKDKFKEPPSQQQQSNNDDAYCKVWWDSDENTQLLWLGKALVKKSFIRYKKESAFRYGLRLGTSFIDPQTLERSYCVLHWKLPSPSLSSEELALASVSCRDFTPFLLTSEVEEAEVLFQNWHDAAVASGMVNSKELYRRVSRIFSSL